MIPQAFLCCFAFFILLQNAASQTILEISTDSKVPQSIKQLSVTNQPNSNSRSSSSRHHIRPFRTTTKSPEEEALNDIDDDPIPTKIWIPAGLDFSCKGKSPGYYSDPSPMSKCQVYHMCMPDGRKYSMLCGIGTIFNQITFVCDHWYNYRCSDAESDYTRNDQLWDQYLSPVYADNEEDDYPETQPTPAT